MADALEWQTEESRTCSCGFPLDESTAAGRDDAYDAAVLVCHACAQRDRVVRGWQRDGGDMAGIRARVWETEEA